MVSSACKANKPDIIKIIEIIENILESLKSF